MAKTAILSFGFIFYITFDLVRVQHIDSQKFLKTKWMTHLGCFNVNGFGDVTNIKMTTITNNQPKTCSRLCRNWNFFALLASICVYLVLFQISSDKLKLPAPSVGFTCFCFDDDTFQKMRKSVSNRCYKHCPDYKDNMYCGSVDMQYVNIYRREKGLIFDKLDQDLDCLAAIRQENRIQFKQISCNQDVSFICSGKNRPEAEKSIFTTAKHFCENSHNRLLNLYEGLPQNVEDNTYYWIGTFRQLVNQHEESTIHHSTTAGLIPMESTQDIHAQKSTRSERTVELDNITTERSTFEKTSANLPTKLSKFFAKEESVTQYGTMSKSIKSEEHRDDLNCGIFCVVLGIFSSCVSILVLLVCLFKIKEKWNSTPNKNEQLSNNQNVKEEHISDDTDDFKENRPVYLDPSNQKAVFHKNNLSMLHINQHIYDEAGIYSKTNLPSSRQACVSGYQELNFGTDKTKDQNVQESDDDESVKYEDPWGKSTKNSKENSKLKPSKKKRFSFGFRSSNFRRHDTSNTEAYEETVINHKQYVYDQPTLEKKQKRKTEPWVNYKYRPSLPVGIGGFTMTGGRGLSIAETNCSRDIESSLRKTENPPDIILHNSITGEDTDSNIYATPQVPTSENEKAKGRGSKLLRKLTRKRIKSKLLKIPKSIKKIRRQTVATTEDEYDIPNPVGRPATNTQSLLIESNDRHGLPVHYEFASPLANTNRCSNLASEHLMESKGLKRTHRMNTKSALISPYQLAKPLPNPRETAKEKEIVYFEPVA